MDVKDLRVMRCSLGGEQFLFVHREAVWNGWEAEAQLMPIVMIDTEEGIPWAGFVWSAALDEWLYRGAFLNAQVGNFADVAGVPFKSFDSPES